MIRAACNILRSRLSLPVVAFLLTPTLFTRPAAAQDDAGMQAAQLAQQAAQQANDAAMQANQQMMQANQQMMMDTQNQMVQQSIQAAQAAAMNDAATSTSSRQQPLPTLPSYTTPVPPQVRAARTIFLANDGSTGSFPIDPNVAYEAVYNALQSWGHYQFADTAQNADLIFQLHGVAPITDVSGGNGSGIYTSTSPAFQLIIRDPKTNTRLWTVTSPVIMTGRGSTRDYWQNVDIENLVSRVKVLAGQQLSPEETATLTAYPKNHSARTALVVSGVAVGLAVGGAIALHSAFEHSVNNMKASQDAFCVANHIPLSECAGG